MKRFGRCVRREVQAKPGRGDAWAASVRRATGYPMSSGHARARCPGCYDSRVHHSYDTLYCPRLVHTSKRKTKTFISLHMTASASNNRDRKITNGGGRVIFVARLLGINNLRLFPSQKTDVFRYKQNDITDFWVPITMSKLYFIEQFFANVGVSVSKSEKCTLRNKKHVANRS